MTDGERELLLRRLFDKGLLPLDGDELGAATLETLSDRDAKPSWKKSNERRQNNAPLCTRY